MKKFIAHGAIATVISAAALVPLAGASQAVTPQYRAPQAVAPYEQSAAGDASAIGTRHHSDSQLGRSYWEGFRDGYRLGQDRRIRDDDDRRTRREAYWDGFRDGYRLGRRHRRHYDDTDRGYDHRRRHHHRRHHHHHRHHHRHCPLAELLGI